MCDAVTTLAVVGIGAAVGGTVMNVMGNIQQGKAQKAQYDYQAQMAQYNAGIAQEQADNAAARGNAQIEEHRQQVNRMRGEGRANYGAAGVVLGQGSALDWEQDLDVQANYDERKLRYNSQMEQWGYETQSQNSLFQAEGYKTAGKNAYNSGWSNAFGSLVSGIGSTAMAFTPLARTGTATPQSYYNVTAQQEGSMWMNGGGYTGSYSGMSLTPVS